MDGWMDEFMDAWMDEWMHMDGWMYTLMIVGQLASIKAVIFGIFVSKCLLKEKNCKCTTQKKLLTENISWHLHVYMHIAKTTYVTN